MWDSKTYALCCRQNLCTLTIFIGHLLKHISWSKTLKAPHMEQCHPPGTCQALAVLEFPVLLEVQDYAAYEGAQLQPNADAAHKAHQKFMLLLQWQRSTSGLGSSRSEQLHLHGGSVFIAFVKHSCVQSDRGEKTGLERQGLCVYKQIRKQTPKEHDAGTWTRLKVHHTQCFYHQCHLLLEQKIPISHVLGFITLPVYIPSLGHSI